MAQLPPEQVRPKPLINGHDLIAEGYAQGPRFSEMLSAVEDAQLEGRLGTKDEALKFVRAEFPR
jgi:poly(A) polymerase